MLIRGGRRRKFPYEKMLEALDYCIAYCDETDDCEDCMYKDVAVHKSTECPIYVITALRDKVKEQLNNA